MTTPDFGGMSDDDLRRLATVLQQSGLSFDPVTMRKATVTAVNLASTPPTVSIQLSGDTTTTVDGVRVFRAYTPVVNDSALILKQGKDLLALGTVAASSYGIGTTDYVRYARTATQNISNATITKAILTSAEVTDTSTVTVSTDRDFSLVRGGIHNIEATVPWQSNNLGSRWAFIGLTSDSATRYAVSELDPSNGSFPIHNISVTRRFTAGTTLSLWVFQDCSTTLALGPGSGIAPLDLNITWIRP